MRGCSWKSNSMQYSRRTSDTNRNGTSIGPTPVFNSKNDPWCIDYLALNVLRFGVLLKSKLVLLFH